MIGRDAHDRLDEHLGANDSRDVISERAEDWLTERWQQAEGTFTGPDGFSRRWFEVPDAATFLQCLTPDGFAYADDLGDHVFELWTAEVRSALALLGVEASDDDIHHLAESYARDTDQTRFPDLDLAFRNMFAAEGMPHPEQAA